MRALILAVVVALVATPGAVALDPGGSPVVVKAGVPDSDLDANCVTYSTSGDAHVNAKGCVSYGP